MKGLGGTEMGVAHILKIEGNKLAAVNAESQQFLFDQVQHDRLSAAADAGENFDQFIPHKGSDASHIEFPFNHGSSLLSVIEHITSISELQTDIVILSDILDKIKK